MADRSTATRGILMDEPPAEAEPLRSPGEDLALSNKRVQSIRPPPSLRSEFYGSTFSSIQMLSVTVVICSTPRRSFCHDPDRANG
jgi:hypothetical protein